MGDYPWFRVYSEILTDRKIERIRRMTNLRRVEIRGAWVSLLAMANDSPQRGYLMWSEGVPVDDGEICADLEMEHTDFDALMSAFDRLGMIHRAEGDIIACSNFDHRQFKSDSSTPRVRDWREKQKRQAYQDELPEDEPEEEPEPSNVTETLQKRQCNAPDTDPDTDPEAQTESEQTLPASLGDPPPPLIRKTLLPDEISNPDPILVQAWQSSQPELKMRMLRATYDTYIIPINPICIKDETVIFITGRPYVKEWCELKLKEHIEETLLGALGRRVDFSVAVMPAPGGT